MNLFERLRSFILVPADRPDLAGKAAARGADAVVVDLEESVPPEAKAAAREAVPDLVALLREASLPVVLRLNLGAEGQMEARRFADLAIAAFALPRAETVGQIQEVAAIIRSARGSSDLGVVPVIETARGIVAAPALAAADTRVLALAFAADNLAAEMMIEPGPPGLSHPGQQVVIAARAAGRPAIGVPGPVVDFGGPEAFRRTCVEARALGFSGAVCLHPGQVTVANAAFMPSEPMVIWAEGVIEDAGLHGGGLRRGRDGRLIDRAAIERAKLVLARTRRGH